MTIPNSPEEADARWLNEVLCDEPFMNSRRIVGVRHETIGQGIGLASRLTRVHLTLDAPSDGAPATLILKTPSDHPAARDMARRTRIYEREVRFYRELAGVSGVRTPRCYYAEVDAESGDFALLMEDIGHLRLGDMVNAPAARDVIAAIGELSKLHAAWWDSPRLGDMEWVPRLEAGFDWYVSRWDERWPVFCQRYPGLLSPGQEEELAALPNHLRRVFARSTRGPRTLLHQDFRLDNLAFRDAGGDVEVTILDWQTLTCGPALWDIAYLLSQNLEPEVRSAVVDDMLSTYHTALCNLGVRGYSLARCRRDYRLQMVAVLLRQVIVAGGPLGADDSIAKDLVAITSRRVVAAASDAGVFRLTEENLDAVEN